MEILLDTHIALWAILDDARLPAAARDLIVSFDNTVWVSAVSVWEIAIKHGLGKGDMPVSGRDALRDFEQSGFRMLRVSPEHAAAVEDLPRLHGDPFDRLLVAQAVAEPLRLLTHDPMVARYGSGVILV